MQYGEKEAAQFLGSTRTEALRVILRETLLKKVSSPIIMHKLLYEYSGHIRCIFFGTMHFSLTTIRYGLKYYYICGIIDKIGKLYFQV
jgi:threonyl-tRNA synthetase